MFPLSPLQHLCPPHKGEEEGEGEEGEEGEPYPGEDLAKIIGAGDVSEQKALRDRTRGREGGRGRGRRGRTEGGEEKVAVEVAGFGEEEEEQAE
jgi:hypothetical protein